MVAKDANLPDAAIVRGEARDLDHDRYLAALLAPAPARDALMTVAAFHGEISRIPTSVREPAMGAIRLQWWRDTAGGDAAADQTGSPVAARLRHAIESGALPLAEVLSIVDAYETLLQPGVLADAAALDAFLDESQGAAFRLSARILGVEDGEVREIIGAAAQSYGRVQLLRALPLLFAKGHNPFALEPAQDWAPVVQPILAATRRSLAEVRRLMPVASLTLRTAILPVALVEPYLAALERLGSRIASEQAGISPLSRVWRIYVAKRRGRL
jgi:15-cis-phytoene synthase